ncbi:hypothetical protein K2173_013289 [Erythroxylum novogranatense]|uniref:Uncharacterized protein n=1 Tax=Erythroxylum novogranatense TaxID=1862640 RepID=A0AAV8S9N2_9ROSI|nr:hypothetical protein K2173_013289 [Erythroxylum novogranatense]
MKPVSKNIRRSTNSSHQIHLKPKGTSSSAFDLTKLTHALDLVDAKTVETTEDSIVEQTQSSSSFDFRHLSDALSVADGENKKTTKSESKLKMWRAIVKTDRGLSIVTCEYVDMMEHRSSSWKVIIIDGLADLPIRFRMSKLAGRFPIRFRMKPIELRHKSRLVKLTKWKAWS